MGVRGVVAPRALRVDERTRLRAACRSRSASRMDVEPTQDWTGTNFDIIPGITALALIPWASRLRTRTLQAWNLGMAGVLVVTVVTAVLAAPTPFRQIAGDPPNVFIASFPFIWLPTVLVASAWLGHIVLFRRLRRA